MKSEQMCDHKLNVIKTITASGAFKYECTECGQFIYREHPRATLPLQVLFIDRIGILFFALVFLLFQYLPTALLSLAALIAGLYAWDVVSEPLKVFTEEEQVKERNKNKLILAFALVVLILSVWVAINET